MKKNKYKMLDGEKQQFIDKLNEVIDSYDIFSFSTLISHLNLGIFGSPIYNAKRDIIDEKLHQLVNNGKIELIDGYKYRKIKDYE